VLIIKIERKAAFKNSAFAQYYEVTKIKKVEEWQNTSKAHSQGSITRRLGITHSASRARSENECVFDSDVITYYYLSFVQPCAQPFYVRPKRRNFIQEDA
jgi:hypothetical protein